MRRYLLGKTLALSIVVLFIGVGIHPAFAVEDKTSSDSFIIDSDNETSVNSNGKIYQNVNCFVMGSTSNTLALKKEIAFGGRNVDFGPFSARGWIYTRGKSVNWKYEGDFKGDNLGEIRVIVLTHLEYYQIGVKGFRGFALGGEPNFFPWCFFIGFADTVRIITV
jgi:hypothetical protein